MKKVKITVIRKVHYNDLSAKYENPISHACDVKEGQEFISINGEKPQTLCDSAWESMQSFVKELANGGGNFYDGWMKNPYSAMISCNDGFRPVSFYIETPDERSRHSGPAERSVLVKRRVTCLSWALRSPSEGLLSPCAQEVLLRPAQRESLLTNCSRWQDTEKPRGIGRAHV